MKNNNTRLAISNKQMKNNNTRATKLAMNILKGYYYMIIYLIPFLFTISPLLISIPTLLTVIIFIAGTLTLMISHTVGSATIDHINNLKDQLNT